MKFLKPGRGTGAVHGDAGQGPKKVKAHLSGLGLHLLVLPKRKKTLQRPDHLNPVKFEDRRQRSAE
ncbi:hypothetical protein N9227_00300 [bacterium]|jgi:hypothetical protein|nr:hypothetical protein [bacterium]